MNLNNCTLEQLNEYIALHNVVQKIQSGNYDQIKLNVDVATITNLGESVSKVKWETIRFGPLANKAGYCKTPHGILVQNQDGSLSLFSTSMAESIIGVMFSQL